MSIGKVPVPDSALQKYFDGCPDTPAGDTGDAVLPLHEPRIEQDYMCRINGIPADRDDDRSALLVEVEIAHPSYFKTALLARQRRVQA